MQGRLHPSLRPPHHSPHRGAPCATFHIQHQLHSSASIPQEKEGEQMVGEFPSCSAKLLSPFCLFTQAGLVLQPRPLTALPSALPLHSQKVTVVCDNLAFS